MKLLTFNGFWTKTDAYKNPTHLFVFGDNDVKKGTKGQAIIRYCSNAVGIPTKKYPCCNNDAYYYDSEYDDNIKKINIACDEIKQIIDSNKYEVLVLPEDGLGTGLANLSKNAPRTLEYLNGKIAELIQYAEK